jgi:hypothetical protein
MEEHERALFKEQLKSNSLLRTEQKLDARLNEFLADNEKIGFMAKICNLAEKSRNYRKKKAKMAFAAISFMLVWVLIAIFQLNRIPNHQQVSAIQPDKKNSVSESTISFPEVKKLSNKELHKQERFFDNDCFPLSVDPYRILPEYEILVGSIYRHGDLILTSPCPVSNCNLKDSIVFSWKSMHNHDLSELTIRFTDNRGNQVRQSTLDQSALRFTILAQTLGPGLFYWKILVNEELTGVGKVSIQ